MEKRVNKSKEEIIADMKHKAKVSHNIEVAKSVFPFIENQKSIYDAQTALNAAAGFIKAEIQKTADTIKVIDVTESVLKSLEAEKDSEIKTVVIEIVKFLKDEPANDASSLLESFGRTLGSYSANEFMKKPMADVKITDIITS